MKAEEYLKLTHTAEKLKDTTRHCYTSGGRRESVAEHCFRIAYMALFLKDEFPEADTDKVVRMCLLHDMGEAFTGDIPSFLKTEDHERTERELLFGWVDSLPAPYNSELRSLYEEMIERKTLEARIFKALDGLEAVIQHNESDISTWEENEYSLNLVYAADRVGFSPMLTRLRELMREETEQKIAEAGK
ncbi:MAG: HD domain-containing protein [Clostridia bacterium]|nr:HD domain-containing protein [Clostridia bacterium]